MEDELRQRLDRIEGFAWATMMGVRTLSPAAETAIDGSLVVAKTIAELRDSRSGTETTCESTGKGNGDESDG